MSTLSDDWSREHKCVKTNSLTPKAKLYTDEVLRKLPSLTWKESQAMESSGCEGGFEVCVPSLRPVM